MRRLTMDYQLTVEAIARRAESMAAERPLIWRSGDGAIGCGDWSGQIERARRLAVALGELGIRPGDRVATLCWNQREHLDAYFAVPMLGAVLHTLNPRLRAADLAAILDLAGTRAAIVDHSLADLLGEATAEAKLEHTLVCGGPAGDGLEYEALLSSADPGAFRAHPVDERDGCALCFTTGTTGAPKGVLYSHRAVALQALGTMAADFGGVCAADTILVIVPMFHGNAWNQPYAAALAGSSLVLPHADMRAETLLATIESERVTMTGGVPTVWQGVLDELDERPDRYDLSSLRIVRIGGGRMPAQLHHGLAERHGLPIVPGFGMTELGPIGGLSPLPGKTGRTLPFLEVRARGEDGLVAWDGETIGELEYRGPSVAGGYWGGASPESFTADGWLRSGDMATIDPTGVIDIRDRSKDMIKSGGEWISSTALEQALETHPGVAEAAVIAIPHERWQERPLAVFVPTPGIPASDEELRAHLRALVPRWWLPDRFERVESLPRTGVGKLRKHLLRERFG